MCVDRHLVWNAIRFSAVIIFIRCDARKSYSVCATQIIYIGGRGKRHRPENCLLNTLIAFRLCSFHESAVCVVKIDCVSENKLQATNRPEIRRL